MSQDFHGNVEPQKVVIAVISIRLCDSALFQHFVSIFGQVVHQIHLPSTLTGLQIVVIWVGWAHWKPLSMFYIRLNRLQCVSKVETKATISIKLAFWEVSHDPWRIMWDWTTKTLLLLTKHKSKCPIRDSRGWNMAISWLSRRVYISTWKACLEKARSTEKQFISQRFLHGRLTLCTRTLMGYLWCCSRLVNGAHGLTKKRFVKSFELDIFLFFTEYMMCCLSTTCCVRATFFICKIIDAQQ